MGAGAAGGGNPMPAAVCAPMALPPLGSGGGVEILKISLFCNWHLHFKHLKMIYEGAFNMLTATQQPQLGNINTPK